jgi:glycosyltransferase involved in cell wall biosynthesis
VSEGTVALVLDGAGRAGTERHVLGLLRELRTQGIAVLLVTSRPGPLAEEAVALGATWQHCPRTNSLGYLARLARLLRRHRPALVHAHSGRLPSLAARLARVPAIVDTRHGIPERLRPLYAHAPWLRRWEGVKSRLAHRTLCVCEADADWMERQAKLPRQSLRVVPNGFEPPPGAGTEPRRTAARAALGLTAQEPVIAFVGRLAPQKAPRRVLELLRSLRAGLTCEPSRPRNGASAPMPAPRAVICGAGPLEADLRSAAEEMGLREAVLWTGEVEDPGTVLAAADLLLLPSEWEGLPYVLLESMAEGTPVLATPVGGVPEVLAGPLAAGCLPWSPQTWVAAARQLLGDPDARARWRTAAAARLRDYPQAAALRGILAAYRELGWRG